MMSMTTNCPDRPSPYRFHHRARTIDETAEALLAFSRSFKKVRPSRAKTVQPQRKKDRKLALRRTTSLRALLASKEPVSPVSVPQRETTTRSRSLPDIVQAMNMHSLSPERTLSKLVVACNHVLKPNRNLTVPGIPQKVSLKQVR